MTARYRVGLTEIASIDGIRAIMRVIEFTRLDQFKPQPSTPAQSLTLCVAAAGTAGLSACAIIACFGVERWITVANNRLSTPPLHATIAGPTLFSTSAKFLATSAALLRYLKFGFSIHLSMLYKLALLITYRHTTSVEMLHGRRQVFTVIYVLSIHVTVACVPFH